jgi:hypothetical protein
MKTDGNQYAFPTQNFMSSLTKREYFAAMAMQGILATNKDMRNDINVSYWAVYQADALINELNNTQE